MELPSGMSTFLFYFLPLKRGVPYFCFGLLFCFFFLMPEGTTADCY